MHLKFDLGPDFRVSGRGLDHAAGGHMDLTRRQPAARRQITGVIRTVGGNYEAYGTRMNIDHGELRFHRPGR
jgi:translocation and assembly module TamB